MIELCEKHGEAHTVLYPGIEGTERCALCALIAQVAELEQLLWGEHEAREAIE